MNLIAHSFRKCVGVYLLCLFAFYAKCQLKNIAEEWKKDPALKHASIGYCVIDASSSEILAEYNSRQLLIPASTLKIVTTSAALGILGSNYRYETKVCYNGKFNRITGVLEGDLIVSGSGDPTLQSDYFEKDSVSVSDKWAQQLKEKGIREITGSIIGDASYFDRQIPSNWIWEDISNYFGAVPCGLSYHDNKFKVYYNTGEAGSIATIINYSPRYLHDTIHLTSDVVSKGSEDQAYAYGDPFSFKREIRGTLPPNKKNYDIEVALPDPALLCAEQLCSSLLRQGIKCRTDAARSLYISSENTINKQALFSHYSPTLDRIVYFTNLKSNNQYCEALLRTLGKGNKDQGLKAVKNYWASRGMDSSEIYMDDASGLARLNTTSPYYQASLLGKIFRDNSVYQYFNASLPVAGKQGSMSSIGKGKYIEGNMRAKTGYLTRVRAYCGYVKARSGKELAFSIIFNNYNCSPREARLKMEKFLVALGEM